MNNEYVDDELSQMYEEVGRKILDAETFKMAIRHLKVLKWFIQAPQDPIIAIYARNWAMANGSPIVPGVACSAGMRPGILSRMR